MNEPNSRCLKRNAKVRNTVNLRPMKWLKKKLAAWKLKRKWRHVPLKAYPLVYIGPDMKPLRGVVGLKYGTPVAPVSGVKGAPGSARVRDPIDIERVVHKDKLRERT